MCLLKIVTMALSVIVLSQNSLGNTARLCTYSREGPPSVVQGVSQETISNLKMLLDGLQAQSQLVRIMLPRATEHFNYYIMMKSLTALSEHEERLKALVTLSGSQNDPELAALQAVLENLAKNTCFLFREVYSLDECSYEVLKKLKFIIETFDVAEESSAAIRSSLNALTGGRASSTGYKKWVANVLMCSLSDEEISLISAIDWPYFPPNKDCC